MLHGRACPRYHHHHHPTPGPARLPLVPMGRQMRVLVAYFLRFSSDVTGVTTFSVCSREFVKQSHEDRLNHMLMYKRFFYLGAEWCIYEYIRGKYRAYGLVYFVHTNGIECILRYNCFKVRRTWYKYTVVKLEVSTRSYRQRTASRPLFCTE